MLDEKDVHVWAKYERDGVPTFAYSFMKFKHMRRIVEFLRRRGIRCGFGFGWTNLTNLPKLPATMQWRELFVYASKR